MLNAENDIYLVPITAASLLLVVAVSIFSFFALYRRKQQGFIRDKENLSKEFQNTLLRSKIEISEQTLQTISQEIHDNIGQRLTLAAMQLNDLENERMVSSRQLITTALQDLRNLSKNLSGAFVLDNGLEMAIERETRLLESIGINCSFTCRGEMGPLSDNEEVILFRCVQEILHNALRHSGGDRVSIVLEQNPQEIRITISDNGQGISSTPQPAGQGLLSIHERMRILGGKVHIDSAQGTSVTLDISHKQNHL